MEEKDLSSLLGHLGELSIVKDRVQLTLKRAGCLFKVTFPQLDSKEGKIGEEDVFNAMAEFESECEGIEGDPSLFEAFYSINRLHLQDLAIRNRFLKLSFMEIFSQSVATSNITYISLKIDGRLVAFFGDGKPEDGIKRTS